MSMCQISKDPKGKRKLPHGGMNELSRLVLWADLAFGVYLELSIEMSPSTIAFPIKRCCQCSSELSDVHTVTGDVVCNRGGVGSCLDLL